MVSNPKVSVFIASYNHARYLPECLDSILAQTYTDFEIVIVDDGSTDGSTAILEDYQRRYPEKIRYSWHPEHGNWGVSRTSNDAIQKSRGEYLAWTGSDDAWYPDKLYRQVEQLDNDLALGAVYSHARFMDGDGQELPNLAGSDICSGPNPMEQIIQSCHPPAMTVVFRRQCLDEVGLFDEKLIYSDWDLMIRVFSSWKVGFIDQPLAKYRIHNNNLSKKIDPRIDLTRIIAMYRRIEEKWSSIAGRLHEPRNEAIFDLQLAFHLFCNHEEDEAAKYLNKAFACDATLGEDANFLDAWLNHWKPAFYTPEHPHFGFWVIDHLPAGFSPVLRSQLIVLQTNHPETQAFFVQRGIDCGQSHVQPEDVNAIFDDCPPIIGLAPAWKKEVLQKVYPALLFDSNTKGDLPKVRYFWKATVGSDPTWLRNRGIWSIGIKTFLGDSANAQPITRNEKSDG
jgi:glycosyltransferase involved in cell wall biosynthesis